MNLSRLLFLAAAAASTICNAGSPRVFNPNAPLFARPNGVSYTWTYGTGTTPDPNYTGTYPVTQVSYHNVGAPINWTLTRGHLEYSTNGGSSWTAYTTAPAGSTNFVPVAGKIWRYVDTSADTTTSQSVGFGYFLSGPPSSVGTGTTAIPDNAPTDIMADRSSVFSGLAQGATLANLTPVDTGDSQGGYWAIDSQSVPNLFAVSFDSTKGNACKLTLGTGTMPAVGQTATVTARYYDVFQTDAAGAPIAGQGFAKQFTFTIVSETSNDLTLGADIPVNTYTTDVQSQPAVATLSDNSLVAVWASYGQGKSSNTYAGIYGQRLSSAGAKVGGEFVISNGGTTVNENSPCISALNAGRFVVAYSVAGTDSDIGFRIIEANGTVGSQIIANSTTAGNQSNPSVTTLTGGSFVIIWGSDNGDVRVRPFNAADGSAAGAEVLVTSGANSGYYPAVTGISSGSYAMAWVDSNTGVVKTKTAAGSVVSTGFASSGYGPPRVAGLIGGSGGYVLATESYNSTTSLSEMYVVRYDNSGAIQGSAFHPNTRTGGNRFEAALAALPGGGFVAGWASDTDDFDLNGLFGRRYTAAGVAVDAAEFEINQHRLDDQSYPFLSALSGDAFAAVWTDTSNAAIAAGTYASDIEARVLLTAAATLPTVTTAAQAGVTYNSATLGGNVTADGGASVTERGIVWNTATGPTTSNNKVPNGTGLGAFSATVNGLTSSTTIYVRAYAINTAGTAYGNEISFATPAAPAPVTAVSGNGASIAYQANAAAASTANGTDFGSVPVAGVTQVNTFTITNSGTAALNLTGSPNYVTISPSVGFSVTSQPSGTITAGGGTTTFTITFDPSSTGAVSATVSFGSDDSTKNPFTFAIVGNGSGPQTFDLAGNAIGNTPYDGSESYIYSPGPAAPTVVFTATVDTPPGGTQGSTLAGTSFDSVRSGSVIASSGAMAFRGFLALQAGPPLVDANNFQGIWKTPDGTTANTVLVTRSGNTAPDSSTALFDVLPVNPVINNAAQTSFTANLRVATGSPAVTTSTDTGVWSELGGTGLHLILREGDSVAGGTAGTVAPSTTVATGDAHTAFTIKLTPTGSALIRAGVSGSTVTLATIAKQGDPAPAVGGGTSGTMGILSGNSSDPRLDAAGDLAFLGSVTGGSRIYYQSVGGSLVALAGTGQTWPGLPDAFVQFERPTLGNSTTIAFRGITVTLQAILKGSPTGTITAITKTGDTTVPGTPAGSQLWSLWSPFSNSLGHIAFRGSLLDSVSVETRCILTDTSGTLSVIAKVGDTAPGTGGDTFVNFDMPVIGDGDQAAFTASTNGGIVGLWRQAAGGGALSLLVKVGDTFTVGSGTETVAAISVPGATSADRTYETKCMDAAGHMVVFITYASGKTGYVLTSP